MLSWTVWSKIEPKVSVTCGCNVGLLMRGDHRVPGYVILNSWLNLR